MRGSIDLATFAKASAFAEAPADKSAPKDAAGLEPLVAAAAARALRLPPEIVGPDVPFARLGLDSLGCLELAGELETALGIHIPPDAVVECTTVRSLCATLGGGATDSVIDRMRADAGLAADLRPRPFVGAASLADARHVLLTGATGFLGSALLDALLTRTTAHVTCLCADHPGVRSEISPQRWSQMLHPEGSAAARAWQHPRRRLEVVSGTWRCRTRGFRRRTGDGWSSGPMRSATWGRRSTGSPATTPCAT